MDTLLDQFYSNKKQGKKSLALLIDPDKSDQAQIEKLLEIAKVSYVDYIFVGGSLLTKRALGNVVSRVKSLIDLPVILFPGDIMQIDHKADAIFFLSLISGRNPEYLIGKHVVAAPILKESGLEIIPTGYILINSGRETTASYMSNTKPIPAHKPGIAACTALAGEMLGLKIVYLDGGSGADNAISTDVIKSVRDQINCPIIVGGGIKTAEKALENLESGADIIVIGNAAESDPTILLDIGSAIHNFQIC